MKSDEKILMIKRYLAICCFWGMTILVPFYYHNAYFDLIEAKAGALRLVFYVMLIVLSGILVVQVFLKCVHNHFWRDFYVLDWAVLGFLAAVCISWLVTEEKGASFFGYEGWNVGVFVLLGCGICYFLISRHLPRQQNLWLPVLITNIIIFSIAIFHSMGIDVLGLHTHIAEHQWFQYISTIGQINAMMGYLTLVFPLFTIFYLVSKDKVSSILYGILVVLGEASIILCASNGIFAVIGVCMFFLLPFIWKDRIRMFRFLGMIAVFGLWIILIAIVPAFTGKILSMDGIPSFIVRMPIGVAICLVATVGAVITQCLIEKKTKIWKGLLYIAEIIMTCIALGVFRYTKYNYTIHYFWGSGRKYLWNYSLEIFQRFPLKMKLFGVGPEMLGRYYGECSEYFGTTVLAAHSEFLQYLLTIGIVGATAWIIVFVTIIYTFWKYHSKDRMTFAYFLPLIAYFAQAALCSPQPVTVDVFCVMLACYRNSLERKQSSCIAGESCQ